MTSRWEVERSVLASDLPPTARLVALTLLAFSDNGSPIVSRKHGPSLTALARCTGLGRSTVARELNRLETEGWLKRERPDMASARSVGARTGYTLCPIVASPIPGLGSPALGLEVVPERDYLVPERDQGGPTAGPEVVPERDTAQTSQTGQQRLRGSQIVIEKTGCTADEAESVLRLIQQERNPRSMVGLVHRIAQDGELDDWLARVRAESSAADKATLGRTPHPFAAGRSAGYCRACGRHEMNAVHTSAA
jgi:DNA-binding Lrp family transcriptional regulator